MSVFHCSCGFAIDDPDEYGDHIRLAFARDDDIGTDGQGPHGHGRRVCRSARVRLRFHEHRHPRVR